MNRPLLRLVRIWPMVMLVLVNAFLCWFSVPVDHKLISSTSCWLGRRKNVDKSGRRSTQLTRWCKPSKNININIIIVLVTMCKTVKVEGFFPWLQYFEGKTSPCRIDKCNPCLANLISWNCSVDVVCTKLCARVQLVFLVRTNFVRRPFHWSKHIQSSAHFQYLEFFWVVRFQHNESLKSFGSLENYVIFSKDFEELLMQGQSMSSISCFWQIERMELIRGRGCSPF